MGHRGMDNIIGINWGSSNCRAYLIGTDGRAHDMLELAAGVTTLTRDGMVAVANQIRRRWPEAGHAYAAGMIGSNVGWTDAGYLDCPASIDAVAQGLVATRIGDLAVDIVPGLACVREADGAPDIMRGEETELLGLLASGQLGDAPMVALPGTHTKWVRLRDGCVQEFMTSMSGELFDRLSTAGLLASVVDGPGEQGPAFVEAVRAAASRSLGLGTLLFGVRARMIRGTLARADTASCLRGLLAGAEIADALALFQALRTSTVPLVGSAPVCRLYQCALAALDIAARPVPSADAVVHGFVAIHALRHPR